MRISIAAFLGAPSAEFWRAYTTPEDTSQWNAASSDWNKPCVANQSILSYAHRHIRLAM